jgi:hypothetical protein
VDASYDDVSVTDAAGRTWRSGDVYATGCRHLPRYSDVVAVLSFFVIVRRQYNPPA